MASLVEPDELQDMLGRAFYASTYGTIFYPGLAYCVALDLLATALLRRQEFTPDHHKLFNTTAIICSLLLLPMLALALIIFDESTVSRLGL